MVLKKCADCREEKPLEQFDVCRRNKDGRYSYCKPCKSEHGKRSHAKRMAAGKAQADNRKRRLAMYGLTADGYDRLLAAQGGSCAVCGSTAAGPGGASMPVDHDHTTGLVRGILCFACNTAIGKFRDSPLLMRQAADYVEAGGVYHFKRNNEKG